MDIWSWICLAAELRQLSMFKGLEWAYFALERDNFETWHRLIHRQSLRDPTYFKKKVERNSQCQFFLSSKSANISRWQHVSRILFCHLPVLTLYTLGSLRQECCQLENWLHTGHYTNWMCVILSVLPDVFKWRCLETCCNMPVHELSTWYIKCWFEVDLI